MGSFKEYYSEKQKKYINDLFDEVCFHILESDLTFDEWWEKKGFQVLISESYDNEEQLLVEFLGMNWGKSTLNPGNWFGGNQGTNWYGGKDNSMANMMGKWQQSKQNQGINIALDKNRKKYERDQGDLDKQKLEYKTKLKNLYKQFDNAFKQSLNSFDMRCKELSMNTYPKAYNIVKKLVKMLEEYFKKALPQAVGSDFKSYDWDAYHPFVSPDKYADEYKNTRKSYEYY